MDEKKKLINWTAGISTVIVALLIIIVVMEPRGNGVSRAAASGPSPLLLRVRTQSVQKVRRLPFFRESCRTNGM